MSVMLERWNDDKMDALDAKVGRLETDVVALNAKVDGLGSQMAEQRQETRGGFERVDEKFERVDDKFDRMHRTLLVIGGAVIATLIAALAGHP